MKKIQWSTQLLETQVWRNFNASPFVGEILIESHSLSRRGSLSDEQVCELLVEMKDSAVDFSRWVLVWDILVDQIYWEQKLRIFEKFLKLAELQKVRVHDLGVAFYLKKHYPDLKLQFILDQGFHNSLAIKSFCPAWLPQMQKLIWPLEMPVDVLATLSPELPYSQEIMVLGPIPMFYSPRKLLSSLISEKISENSLWGYVKSPESHNRHFDTLENKNGTFMFYSKDLYIGDFAAELQAMPIEHWRVDCHHHPQASELGQFLSQNEATFESLKDLEKIWNRATIPGFFKANKSKAVFKTLKNQTLSDRDEAFLGWVVDVQKSRHLAVYVPDGFGHLSEAEKNSFYFLSPLGQKFTAGKLSQILNAGTEQELKSQTLYFYNYQAKIPVGSQLFFERAQGQA